MSQDAQRQTTGRKPRSAAFSEAKNKKSKKRIVKWIAWIVAALAAIYMIFSVGMLWFASGQLLGPSFHGVTRDLSVCKPETAKAYGKDCGNLRTTHEFAFSEIKIPSVNGYDLPGW